MHASLYVFMHACEATVLRHPYKAA